MSNDTARLEALKARMTKEQRAMMAELIQNELKARKEARASKAAAQSFKSSVAGSRLGGGLNPEQVSDIYADVDRKLRQTKIDHLEEGLKGAKRGNGMRSLKLAWPRALSRKNMLLAGGVLFFAVCKVLASTGVVSAAIDKRPVAKSAQLESVPAQIHESQQTAPAEEVRSGWSQTDLVLLTALDARRVELEKRKEALDDRETDLRRQEGEIAAKLTELKSLTARISERRKERDHKHEARMEQLANVYGSMAPAEAAPLIAKLDEEIALTLLERMPEKRLGQILSSMGQDRAIELTSRLTQRRSAD